jgi:Ca2+/H+ antiporter, TMEM165/GDT1 family
MANWTHLGPAVIAAFLASLLDSVEALTTVLAVGTVRGWRPAFIGTGAAMLVLALLVATLGPALGLVPIAVLQVTIGMLLLLFGMRWLREAILRSAGVIAAQDEAVAFAKATTLLGGERQGAVVTWDTAGIVTTFEAVMLEGLEVVFIVIAIGSVGNTLIPATIGAAVACVLVMIVGFALYRPLARVPANLLKFTVGVLVSAFAIFWLGEGLGFSWPGKDAAILGIIVILIAVAVGATRLVRYSSSGVPVHEGSQT